MVQAQVLRSTQLIILSSIEFAISGVGWTARKDCEDWEMQIPMLDLDEAKELIFKKKLSKFLPSVGMHSRSMHCT